MTRIYRFAECKRCHKEKNTEARGLCSACYKVVIREGQIKNYPTLSRMFVPATGDPLIRWIFQEIHDQGKTLNEVSEMAGVSHISPWRKGNNLHFHNFRAVVEALGYEIKIVAKEPADASNENT